MNTFGNIIRVVNKKRGQLFTTFFSFMVLFPAHIALAQVGTDPNGNGDSNGDGFNPLEVDSIYELIRMIFENIVIPIGGVIATLAIVYSGFLFVTAQGNQEQLTRARSAFFWSVVGAVVLLGSWAIAAGIEATLDQILANDD